MAMGAVTHTVEMTRVRPRQSRKARGQHTSRGAAAACGRRRRITETEWRRGSDALRKRPSAQDGGAIAQGAGPAPLRPRVDRGGRGGDTQTTGNIGEDGRTDIGIAGTGEQSGG